MECKSCSRWKEKQYGFKRYTPAWGRCSFLTDNESTRMEISTNNREGEWVETIIETAPDWGCKDWIGKEETNVTPKTKT